MQSQQQHPQLGNQHMRYPQGLVRPSPLPANVPTEQEILAGRAREDVAIEQQMAMHHHERQQQMMRQQQQQQHQQRMIRSHGFDVPPPHMMPPGAMGARPARPPPLQSIDLLHCISQAAGNPDILQRPEAINLQRALDRGDANNASLITSFAHGNLDPFHREVLLNVLKVQQNVGRLPTRMNQQQQLALAAVATGQQQPPPPPPHHVPPPPSHLGGGILPPNSRHSPFHDSQMMHQVQPQQQHVSDLGASCVYPPVNSRKSLSVSPNPKGQQRYSPEQLQQHAKQVYQNALIRRKLEEQKENYRKKQEGSRPQEARGGSDANKADSPLGLSPFTPTVVMKKMAAERRDSDPRIQLPELRVSQEVGPEGDGKPRSQEAVRSREEASQHAGLQGVMMAPVPLPPPNPQRQSPLGANPRVLHQALAIGGGLPSRAEVSQDGQDGNISRFFSAGLLTHGGAAPQMPPLPTQQAMTLEELEMQAASAAGL